jgi:hypothetical protein
MINMKKEIKKRVNKKILILFLVLLSLIIISLIQISAADNTNRVGQGSADVPTGITPAPSSSGFFDRWVGGMLQDRDAKLLLWFLMSIILFLIMYMGFDKMGVAFFVSIPAGFILSTFVTPASIIGIMKSYDTLPLVFLTFFPLAVLFMVTYISVVKGNRTLMTVQWLLWCIYFIYIIVKFISFLYLDYGGGWLDWLGIPDYVFKTFLTNLPQAGTQEYVWYWFNVLISSLVAAAMTFLNGIFMNFAMIRAIGIDKATAKKSLGQLQTGANALINFGKQLEGGAKV